MAEQMLAQAGAFWRDLLRTLATSEVDALLYQRMTASLVYATARPRACASTIERNDRRQSGLWGFGISGDLSIVLLQLDGQEPSAVLRQIIQTQAWWNAFGLRSDLAVLCASGPAGQPGSIDRVRREIEVGPGADRVDKPGGIYVLDGATLDEGDSTLLRSVERIVLTDTDPLDAQIARRVDDVRSEPAPIPTPAAREGTRRGPPVDPPAANGFGDFSPDGREYVITTSAEHMTPALWVNVIANPEFGTLVSESGSATTWSENAHEFRLTPWSNDPVSDPNTEAFYIRDESTGRF